MYAKKQLLEMAMGSAVIILRSQTVPAARVAGKAVIPACQRESRFYYIENITEKHLGRRSLSLTRLSNRQPVLVPLVQNVVRAIATGDEEEIKKTRRRLHMEARKYPKGVRDETGKGRGPNRKFGSARPELLPQPGVNLGTEGNVPESISTTVTSAKEADHPQEDSDSVACAPADSANEMDIEDMDRVSGTISTMVKKELLEIGNELYQAGLQVEMGLIEAGDRLQEIGERLAFIATKLNAE
ncbi:hypothetical protein NLG97_g9706 [Lecanicillium saksenae]|uniref:Uncharacterized protein n=1 Tax=Lecanicillium saksenae TaxID=468837 RepID=A0ACC1QGR0_9HYPO|nr:hypothetical protein NLG97_g9706 [Lecanicillium saksenae]